VVIIGAVGSHPFPMEDNISPFDRATERNQGFVMLASSGTIQHSASAMAKYARKTCLRKRREHFREAVLPKSSDDLVDWQYPELVARRWVGNSIVLLLPKFCWRGI
jgi:hypothetical protein